MGHFLPFYPPNSLKNQNFEKMKKISGDIIILQKCTKNYDQLMYRSWDMVRDRCSCYFSFWAIFCPFIGVTAPKIKISKKWKKQNKKNQKNNNNNNWRCHHLHKFTINYGNMVHCSWDIVRDWCDCNFSFWGIFCPFTPLIAQKIKILKKWKKRLEMSSFYIYV